MSDPHLADAGTFGAAIAAIGLVGAGLAYAFRAAFRIGVESRTSERIASDLAELKVGQQTMSAQLLAQKEAHANQHQAVLLRMVAIETRMTAVEEDVQDVRRSRPDIGE